MRCTHVCAHTHTYTSLTEVSFKKQRRKIQGLGVKYLSAMDGTSGEQEGLEVVPGRNTIPKVKASSPHEGMK